MNPKCSCFEQKLEGTEFTMGEIKIYEVARETMFTFARLTGDFDICDVAKPQAMLTSMTMIALAISHLHCADDPVQQEANFLQHIESLRERILACKSEIQLTVKKLNKETTQ